MIRPVIRDTVSLKSLITEKMTGSATKKPDLFEENPTRSAGPTDVFQRKQPLLKFTGAAEDLKAPESLAGIIRRMATDPATQNKTALLISKHFSPDGKESRSTYANLLTEIQKTAHGLRNLGIKSGHSIAMAEMNTPEFLINYLAGLTLEATMVPLNLLAMQDEKTKTDKFMYMLEKTNANALMIGEDPSFASMSNLPKLQKLQKLRGLLGPMLERELNNEASKICVEKYIRKYFAKTAKTPQGLRDLKTLLDRLPTKIKIITPKDRVRLVKASPLALDKLNFKPKEDLAADILYTSGTSGDPKGVMLSHKNLEFTAESLYQATATFYQPDDVMLMALPLFHIFGKSVQLAALKNTIPVVMIPSLKEARAQMDKLVETIADYKITMFPSVPVILEAFVQYLEKHPEAVSKVQTVRHIISGGAPLKQETFSKLKTLIPAVTIMEGYGSSEGGIDLLNLKGVQGFVGPALPGIEVKINDPDPDTGAGEMLVRSPGVSSGYLKGTATADDQKVFNPDGWYKTGDVARFDPEHQMYQIVGRNSDVIKVAGERRPAEDFEQAMKETGLITDSMAVAYKPDRETEKAVVVAITDKTAATEKQIKDAMGTLAGKNTIPGWSIPKHILVLKRPELPHGFIGFKRTYAATRDFVKKALAEGVVIFKDEPDAKGKMVSSTVVPDDAKLQAFAENYRYSPAPKKTAGS